MAKKQQVDTNEKTFMYRTLAFVDFNENPKIFLAVATAVFVVFHSQFRCRELCLNSTWSS